MNQGFHFIGGFAYSPRVLVGAVMIVWLMDLQLPVQSVPITTNVISSNPTHGEVYSIQHYVIKFASDLRQQVGGFFRILRFLPAIKLTATIYELSTEILLKLALSTINQTKRKVPMISFINIVLIWNVCAWEGMCSYTIQIQMCLFPIKDQLRAKSLQWLSIWISCVMYTHNTM